MAVRVGTLCTAAPEGAAAASVPASTMATARSARLTGLDMVGLLDETGGSPSAGSTGDVRFVRGVALGFRIVTRLLRTCFGVRSSRGAGGPYFQWPPCSLHARPVGEQFLHDSLSPSRLRARPSLQTVLSCCGLWFLLLLV